MIPRFLARVFQLFYTQSQGVAGFILLGQAVLPHLPLTVERLHWHPGYVFESGGSYLALRVLKLPASENLFKESHTVANGKQCGFT